MSPIFIAIGFAFAAAVQPGPLQAFFLSRVAAHGWRRTLPAAFSPLLSDGPIALLVLLVLKQLPPNAARLLQGAGGILLLWFAVNAFRDWRRPRSAEEEAGAAPRTLFKAALVNILNPNPYLGWSLVLGPLVLDALKTGWPGAAAIVVGFYATMVVMLAVVIMVFGAMRSLGARVASVLLLVSAITLAGLGVYQIARAL